MDAETLELMEKMLAIISKIHFDAPHRTVCEEIENLFFKLNQKRHELHRQAMEAEK